MAKATTPKPAPRHDWFLRQWLKACGKEQVDLEKSLEWNKSKASLCMRGLQRYHRDDINQVAAWLEIQPYELLMHPADAMAIRRLRIDARKIADAGPPFSVLSNDDGQSLQKVAEKPVGFIGKDEQRGRPTPSSRRSNGV